MEVSYSLVSLFSCGLVFSVLILIWRAFDWLWLTPKKLEKTLKEQGFRGNAYNLLFGDFKQISSLFKEAHSKPISVADDLLPRAIPHFNQAFKRYGKKAYLWFGTTPVVLIMEPELIKEVTTKIYIFQKSHSNPLSRLLSDGVVNYDGDKWDKHRKILNPAFHMDKLKNMLPAFYTSVSEMLDKWEGAVSGKGSYELDVWPDLQTLTADAISRTAFGSNYEEGRRIFQLQREQSEHFLQAIQSIYIPGWRFFPTKRNRRMHQIANDVHDSIRGIINRRLEAVKAGEGLGDDLLGLLLDSNSEEINNHGNKNSGMNTKEVIEECKLFYLAGQETTASLLVWTIVLLCIYPDWQTRAREEVLQFFGAEKPDFDGLNHLKLVSMILFEVLRLYPPFPALTRRVAKKTTLGDLTLPKQVKIILPTMLLHNDPKIWGNDMKEFKPERFAEGVSHVTKGQVGFFPFGWGPRICIGQHFAMLETKLAVAMILQRFTFELSPSYSHAPRSVIALQPQYGAHLILHKL